MTDLTEKNLEACLLDIKKYMEKTGNLITHKPTKVLYRPADLEALGLTHEDVLKVIKEAYGD